jgi:hypothetical protein
VDNRKDERNPEIRKEESKEKTSPPKKKKSKEVIVPENIPTQPKIDTQ